MALSVEQIKDVINCQGEALVDSRSSDLPEPISIGKVRDTYDCGNDRRLIVATDRISTFDRVHPNGIPGKGIILTQMTKNWLESLKNYTPNHLISTDLKDFPQPFRNHPELAHRSMLVQKLEILPAECIVRGNLTGSAWAEYQKTGTVLGHTFDKQMVESEAFETPIFTPSTKEETGHDRNITYEEMLEIFSQKYGDALGKLYAEKVRFTSLYIFMKAASDARLRGIIIADTKFEFGLSNGQVILGDEVLTPDSSRFWDLINFQLGKSQPSFDKQYVRDWAVSTGWNKEPPAPMLPEDVIKRTQEKYLEAYKRLSA